MSGALRCCSSSRCRWPWTPLRLVAIFIVFGGELKRRRVTARARAGNGSNPRCGPIALCERRLRSAFDARMPAPVVLVLLLLGAVIVLTLMPQSTPDAAKSLTRSDSLASSNRIRHARTDHDGHAYCRCQASNRHRMTQMTEKKSSRDDAPWEHENPRARQGTSTHLSSAAKAAAKRSAKKAGRPYPNMVDNMNAAKRPKKSER
jgi:hypothetical protein